MCAYMLIPYRKRNSECGMGVDVSRTGQFQAVPRAVWSRECEWPVPCTAEHGTSTWHGSVLILYSCILFDYHLRL